MTRMKNRDLLTQKLSKHFSIHPSRQKTLAALIFSALCSHNVHHQSLARYVDSPNPKAGLRKVERFFVMVMSTLLWLATVLLWRQARTGTINCCNGLERTTSLLLMHREIAREGETS